MRPDPDLLMPDQRLSPVASILATGVLRFQFPAALPDSDSLITREIELHGTRQN